jgi:hypothetical protein
LEIAHAGAQRLDDQGFVREARDENRRQIVPRRLDLFVEVEPCALLRQAIVENDEIGFIAADLGPRFIRRGEGPHYVTGPFQPPLLQPRDTGVVLDNKDRFAIVHALPPSQVVLAKYSHYLQEQPYAL